VAVLCGWRGPVQGFGSEGITQGNSLPKAGGDRRDWRGGRRNASRKRSAQTRFDTRRCHAEPGRCDDVLDAAQDHASAACILDNMLMARAQPLQAVTEDDFDRIPQHQCEGDLPRREAVVPRFQSLPGQSSKNRLA
jgi:hypothetical protein